MLLPHPAETVAVRSSNVAFVGAEKGTCLQARVRLHVLFALWCDGNSASPVLAGRDRTASLDRTMHLLGRVAQSMPQD